MSKNRQRPRERRISALDRGHPAAVFCYGLVQVIGEPLRERRYVTWRMDYGHHGYGSELYFPTLAEARNDIARRIRFYRSMMRASFPRPWWYGATCEVDRNERLKAQERREGRLSEPRSPRPWQPKTGEPCSCRPGIERDNCPRCEGTGQRIDFAAIRARARNAR